MWQRKPEREQKEETKQSRWGFRGMTVRDWLELLIVPMVLVGIGLLFEMQQAGRQQATEKQQQALAERRAQDEALQAYLNQMSGLLLERDLRASEKGTEVRTLARAWTLTVLGTLDPSGKTALMLFLVEADLVQRVDRRDPIVSLRGADLSNANLGEANLREADLSDANLSLAILSNANLREANLREADLRKAFSLREANLSEANLSGAVLEGAILSGADLREADLGGANLSGANLAGATGITNEELEQQAISLKGVTMPNGQKNED